MQSVDAARVLTDHGWIGPARVHIDASVITGVEPMSHVATDRMLAPGFVDLQVNGIDDVDVAHADGRAWDRLDTLLLAQGVTSWCPTLVTMPLEHYAPPLDRIADAMARSPAKRPHLVGAHLEGPFLGLSPGAHPANLIVPVDLGWLAALPSHVAVVTLGAEQPSTVAAVDLLTRAGRLVSIGHSQATATEFDAAVEAGARLTTHLFNAMSGVRHRAPGVAVFAMTNMNVSSSLIADGVHVHPRVLLLAALALGPDRMVLVTDSVAWRAGSVGSVGVELRDGAPRMRDGTLAGSAITMDAAVRQCVDAGIATDQALWAASRNPARLLGLRDRGSIAVGRRADMVALSPSLQVEQVWVDGA